MLETSVLEGSTVDDSVLELLVLKGWNERDEVEDSKSDDDPSELDVGSGNGSDVAAVDSAVEE